MSHRTVYGHALESLAALLLAAVSITACSGSSTPEIQPEVIGTLAVDPLHGGNLALPGGPSLEVPVGAVDQAITLRLTRAAGPTGALSARYGFEPAGQVFARPVRVGLPVPAGTAAASIRWSRRGGGFEPIGGAVVADRVVAEVTHFVITVRSMGVLSETVSLPTPGLSLPRLPRAGGQDLFAPTGGVGLTPTISWGAPSIGSADVYSIQIVRFDPGAPVPYTYVAILDTADTSIELPPGVLETGRTYLAVIRAFSRGVSVGAPLRMQLPLAMAVQVTATFQP